MKKNLPSLAMLLAGALYFIWPIPDTNSIRDSLLFLMLSTGALCVYLHRPALKQGLCRLKSPLTLYLMLSLWMLVSALFMSIDTAWSLDEMRGQWLKSALALLAGGTVAGILKEDGLSSIRAMANILFLALMAHVAAVLIQSVYIWSLCLALPTNPRGLTDSCDKANYLSIMALSFVMAELYARTTLKKRFLYGPTALLWAGLFLALSSIYIEGMRNGAMVTLILTFTVIMLYLCRSGNQRKAFYLMVSLLFLAVFGYLNLKADPRWTTLVETVPMALDTETNRAWLDHEKYPLPRLSNGQEVSLSNYLRIAWFKEGLKLVLENPMGVGFGRDAFEKALQRKYGEGQGHSHSGLVDMAVGAGVPGAVLWVMFLASVLRLGYRGLGRGNGFAPLLLFLLALDFGLRMLVDSTVRDHMLQQFLFTAGFLGMVVARHDIGRKRCAYS